MAQQMNYGRHYTSILFFLMIAAHLLVRLPGERILLLLFRLSFTAFLLVRIWNGVEWAKTAIVILGAFTALYLFGIQILIGQFSLIWTFCASVFLLSAALLVSNKDINEFLKSKRKI